MAVILNWLVDSCKTGAGHCDIVTSSQVVLLQPCCRKTKQQWTTNTPTQKHGDIVIQNYLHILSSGIRVWELTKSKCSDVCWPFSVVLCQWMFVEFTHNLTRYAKDRQSVACVYSVVSALAHLIDQKSKGMHTTQPPISCTFRAISNTVWLRFRPLCAMSSDISICLAICPQFTLVTRPTNNQPATAAAQLRR